jgi:hypothetical protein
MTFILFFYPFPFTLSASRPALRDHTPNEVEWLSSNGFPDTMDREFSVLTTKLSAEKSRSR